MPEARLKLYQGKTHTKPIVEDPSEQLQLGSGSRGSGGGGVAWLHVHRQAWPCGKACLCLGRGSLR